MRQVRLLELANVLLRRWKVLLTLPLAAGAAAVVTVLVLPDSFTATATFIASAQAADTRIATGLAGLTAQLGLANVGGADSPRFYGELVKSRSVRDQLLVARFLNYRTPEHTDSTSLLDILKIKGASQLERLEKGRRKLDDMVWVRTDENTNTVRISAETLYPELSAALVNRLIELINRFNLETRRTNAQARRAFIEQRLVSAGEELGNAEAELQRFLERNREFTSSPQLQFQFERLQRQVTVKQEVFIGLRRQYEEARIQEVNDTPVITVIDWAVRATRRSSPRPGLIAMLAVTLGGVLAVGIVFAQEVATRLREAHDPEFLQLASRWRAIKTQLLQALRGAVSIDRAR